MGIHPPNMNRTLIEAALLEGKTPAEVFKELAPMGVSKNMVIGIRYRLRKSGAPLELLKEPMKADPEAKAAAKEKMGVVVTLPTKVTITPYHGEVELDVDEAPEAKVLGVPLHELKKMQCRYPVDHADQHYFCGAPTSDIKRSYCDTHHKLCWFKPERRDRKRAKQVDAEAKWRTGLNF